MGGSAWAPVSRPPSCPVVGSSGVWRWMAVWPACVSELNRRGAATQQDAWSVLFPLQKARIKLEVSPVEGLAVPQSHFIASYGQEPGSWGLVGKEDSCALA